MSEWICSVKFLLDPERLSQVLNDKLLKNQEVKGQPLDVVKLMRRLEP